MSETQRSQSPRWSTMTKLVFTLTLIVVIGALLVRFRTILVPVLMAFVVAYLLQPFSAWIVRKTPLSWRMTVNLIYLVFVLILIGLATWGGVGLVQQVQNLITTIQTTISDLPSIIAGISGKVYTIGPFVFDLSKFDWAALGQQLLSYVQPALGRLGDLVASLAGSAVSTLGWTAFVVLVSYFFLLESGGLRQRIIRIDIPGYEEDIRQLSYRLGRIWNAFLRGQIIIFLSSVVVYTLVLTILGTRFAFGLGLLAGFANFLPYVGPAINWIVLGLVTYFQGSNLFGLAPLAYAALVIVICVVIDQVFNNLVAPRVMAQALKVHPAFVLIAAIVAANLVGVMGIIIAAPLLATLRLVGQYVLIKMLDKDPWQEKEVTQPPPTFSLFRKIRRWWRTRRPGVRGSDPKPPAPAKAQEKEK